MLIGAVRQIDALWQPLAGGALDDSALKEIYIMVHNMSGSAATFQLPQLTEVAHRLEQSLHEAMECKSQPTSGDRAQIEALIETLKAVAGEATGAGLT